MSESTNPAAEDPLLCTMFSIRSSRTCGCALRAAKKKQSYSLTLLRILWE